MSTIDFSHLRLIAIFATVVETGSFAAAARKLLSSRSRISEQVAKLESDLGVRLLQRSTRQLKMTDEGEQVYEKARQLPEVLRAIESISTPEIPAGRVSITMNHDIAHKFFLPLMSSFQQAYPQVHLDLILDDACLDLINEQIDLAIRIGIPKDEALIARPMHEERLAIFASPDYLSHHGTPKTTKELSKHHWVLLNQQHSEDIRLFRQRDKSIEIKPSRWITCNSPLMVQQMVIQGLGIGALLPTTVSKEVEQERLIQLMPSLRSEPMIFSLVYPSRRQLPLRTRVVVDYLMSSDMFS